jgi:hypothetical protein
MKLAELTDLGVPDPSAVVTLAGTVNGVGGRFSAAAVAAYLNTGAGAVHLADIGTVTGGNNGPLVRAALAECMAVGDSALGQKVLVLPPGTTQIDYMTINRPVRVEGCGRGMTTLMQIAGQTLPVITVKPDYTTTDPSTGGTNGAVQVALEGFGIMSPSRIGAGSGLAHGIQATHIGVAKQLYTQLRLRDIYINQVAGDCLQTASFLGWLDADGIYTLYGGAACINLNSVYDDILRNFVVGGALTHNVIAAAAGTIYFDQSTFFASTLSNLLVAGLTDITVANSFLDVAGNWGAYMGMSAGGYARFPGTSFRYNGQAANTYADVYCQATNAGVVDLTKAIFRTQESNTSSVWPGGPLHNIQIDAGFLGEVMVSPETVLWGSSGRASRSSSGFCNNPSALTQTVQSGTNTTVTPDGVVNAAAQMVYPPSGVPYSTGTGWGGGSYTTAGNGTVLALAANPTFAGTTSLTAAASADATDTMVSVSGKGAFKRFRDASNNGWDFGTDSAGKLVINQFSSGSYTATIGAFDPALGAFATILAPAAAWSLTSGTYPVSNKQMVFELVSDTSLRVKVRGSDGTIRSATLALA